MGRPSTMGKKLLFRDNMIIGICLGSGGYSEHNVSSEETVREWVKYFNKADVLEPLSPDLKSIMNEERVIDYEIAVKESKHVKEDFEIIQKLYKDRPQLAPYILRPHLHTYTRSFIIDNTEMLNKGRKPALLHGEYSFISIESQENTNQWYRYIERRIGNKRKICEADLIQAEDYCNSNLTSQGYFLGNYSVMQDSLQVFMSKENNQRGIEAFNLIEQKLKIGRLALVMNWNNYGLSLIFTDRYLYGKDIN